MSTDKARYHDEEFRVHQKLGVAWFQDELGLSSESVVLDVGCGAGQTLRLLAPLGPKLSVGVDIDEEALAIGQAHAPDIRFVRASGEALPFADETFTHVISRLALTYMRQGKTVAEMLRVMKPGALLYCEVEGPGYAKHRLSRVKGPGPAWSWLRYVFFGVWCELAGGHPGDRAMREGRPFLGAYRLRRQLERHGGVLVDKRAISHHGKLPKVYRLIIRKRT